MSFKTFLNKTVSIGRAQSVRLLSSIRMFSCINAHNRHRWPKRTRKNLSHSGNEEWSVKWDTYSLHDD